MLEKKNTRPERISYPTTGIEWITSWTSTLSRIKKSKEALESHEQTSTLKNKESIQRFEKILFNILKKGKDESIQKNRYLLDLTQQIITKKKLYNGLYKIDVIKKDKQGIVCRIRWVNYQSDIEISNETIMSIKPPKDTQEDWLIIQKTYTDKGWKIFSKERKGKPEDFLMEIEYKDSVMIEIQNNKIRGINPDDITDEIKKYIQENNKNKAQKIQTAMKFFNESKDRISSEYIQDFFRWVAKKQEKRQTPGKEKISKEEFAKVLIRFINKEKNYVHKWSDIDKSTLQFLLKKLWVDKNTIFHEINHNEVDTTNDWLFWDVGWTAHGIKHIDTIKIWENKKPQKTTKSIISEHIDWSDESLLSNRPWSTSRMIFRIAHQLWIIPKTELPQMERFMHFVNTIDTMGYQISSIDYPNNYQTLFGLYRKMDIKDIYEYFQNPNNNGFEKLSPEYMKHIKVASNNNTRATLNDISNTHHARINRNIENFKLLQEAKEEFTFKNTKYIVDLDWKIEDGPETAGYHNYWYFTIGKERGNIYMYSPKPLPFMIEWFSTDNNFLIINDPKEKNIQPILQRLFHNNEEIRERVQEKIEKTNNKQNKDTIKNIIKERTEKILWVLEEKNLKIGKKHQAIINNISNKMIYVNLNEEGTIKGMIRCENKQEAKKFNKWDIIKVRIEEIKKDEKYPFLIVSMTQ